MAWQDRTIDEIYATMRLSMEQKLQAGGLMLPSQSIADNTYIGVSLMEMAAQVHDLHGHIRYRGRQLHADTAELEMLERHASEVGIFRKAATAGSGAVTFTGENGTEVPAGTRLQSTAAPGVVFKTAALVTIAAGEAIAAIVATTPGAKTNLAAATGMSLVVPIAGVDPSATITVDGMSGGVDEETDSSLLERYLFRKRNPPRGGKPSDYIVWMRGVPGVARAWVPQIPEPQRGHVTGRFVIEQDAGGPIPTEAQRLAVQERVEGHVNEVTGQWDGKPAGVEFHAVIVTPRVVDFTVKLDSPTAAVIAAAETAVRSQLLLDAAPGGTIRYSRLSDAVSGVLGESFHKLVAPADDIVLGPNEYPVVGDFDGEAY